MNQTVERPTTKAHVGRFPANDGLLRMAMAVAAAAELRQCEVPVVVKKLAPAAHGERSAVRVDFHAVEPHQRDIDRRLANWGLWCNGTTPSLTSPMFRMTPPPPRVRGDMAYSSTAVDRADAAQLSKLVAALPRAHRAAINWHYVKPVSPRRACQAIGTTMEGLAMLVRDGRQMLINKTA